MCAAQSTDPGDPLSARLDAYLSECQLNGFWGAVLVARSGKIVLNKGYGVADKGKGTGNTATTVFDIGSNTKQFTGAAILKLVELGKLKVTDPLSNFFENLPEDKQGITVHQLLTHSAGLVDAIGRDFDETTTASFFSELFASPLLHDPGTKFSYANTGYSILARIIEIVSKQDYEKFLNEQLFAPAGMEQTGYLLPTWVEANLARGYARNIMDQGSTVTRYRQQGVSWHLKGNGGLNSTQEDMYRWLVALKNYKVLPKPLFETLTTAYHAADGKSFDYGYGWGISRSDSNTKRITHNGSNGVFSHSIIWRPEEELTLLFSTNANSPEVERLAYSLEKMVFDKDYEAKAIKKNVFYFIHDFMQHNEPGKSAELGALIKRDYKEFDSGTFNRIAYMNLETEGKAWSIELFKMNVQLYPGQGNLWDSLGDGYLAMGQKDLAKTAFEKALALKSDDDCYWCEESQAKLDALASQ